MVNFEDRIKRRLYFCMKMGYEGKMFLLLVELNFGIDGGRKLRYFFGSFLNIG